ncbi:uncharacterized protein LOC132708685 [Cylas formicarius]|uniref:uncharacterized protein LOC132708685 n=1 Tax=Cylas formicarius TaxID=197179 RepID=UPI00295836CA|nr:uncharacterized protein LOC132708685 [Cylas formicarius]
MCGRSDLENLVHQRDPGKKYVRFALKRTDDHSGLIKGNLRVNGQSHRASLFLCIVVSHPSHRVGMLVFRISTLFILPLLVYQTDGKPASSAKARQYIPPLPGLVPVYIRPGDTPLQDINLDLAKAFAFNVQKHGRLAFGRQINEILSTKSKNDEDELSKVDEDDEFFEKNQSENDIEPDYHHIQKIPKH